jgi:TPR repeat protein
MCFSSGSGVDKNEAEAVKWFVASARHGFPPAMDNLSSCYDLGLGVKKDASEAMVWKIRGRAARGDRNAATWLRQNGHSMR